jgi:hypothetical protein
MSATATFVIDFGGIENAYLKVTLDSVKNNGKSSFSQGDEVFFRVAADVNYTIETTSGVINNGTVGKQELITNELLSFIKGEPASVSEKIVNIVSNTWYGNNLGAITSASITTVQAANADENSLGIASIDYNTDYNEHSIIPPVGMTAIWHILVYIKAVA